MIFITYSNCNKSNIKDYLGLAEYSYYFVRKSFTPLLEKLGIVVNINDPKVEVDPIYRFCQAIEEECLFLSFAPPHKTTLDLECPIIPVFAWEFADIPYQTWDHDLRNDWQIVLKRLGCAITHSRFACNAVTKYMGNNFPVIDLPSPVWDQFNQSHIASGMPVKSFNLHLVNSFTDTYSSTSTKSDTNQSENNKVTQTSEAISSECKFELSLDELTKPDKKRTRTPAAPKVMKDVEIEGVIYTSTFNPFDGRKNWQDTLKAFCLSHKDNPDAVLILKMTTSSPVKAESAVRKNLSIMPDFKCRVLAIYEHLSLRNYNTLAQNTSFVVNTSHGEGQCLPLMEFMSMGVPAIAPNHSSMQDYINHRNAFIIESSKEPAAWPHDPRHKMLTFRYRLNFESILDGFQKSYNIARNDIDFYERMSNHAIESLKAHCSDATFLSIFKQFLENRNFTIEPDKQYDWNAFMQKHNIIAEDESE